MESIEGARIKRDAMAQADNDYWASLVAGDLPAKEAYERAVARAKSLKLEYRPMTELLENASLAELVARTKLIKNPADRVTTAAIPGGADEASTTLDEAFDVFEKIGLAEANRFYEWWLDRIEPSRESGRKPLSASVGNKDMDTMRTLLGEFMKYKRKDVVYLNPFAGLRFKDRKTRTRPPFSEKWIREKILAGGALDGLNENDIKHRTTRARHPWTNGQVERMNRTIKDATVRRFYYDSHDQLRQHLADCNFARRLKTLKGLTPYEFICRAWTSQPQRFTLDPLQQMPGSNS